MISSLYRYRLVTLPLPSRYPPVTVSLPSRYRSVTVPLPFLGLIKHRYLPVTVPLPYRYSPLLTVTHRYSILLILKLQWKKY